MADEDGRKGRMGEWANGQRDDQKPLTRWGEEPGGARNSARRGRDCSIELVRAGFEPFRARASSERLEYRLNRCDNGRVPKYHSILSHPRRGSQPARESLPS